MSAEQSVIVSFKYGLDDDLEALETLSDELEVVLEKEAVGELQGHEISMDSMQGQLLMHGPNAERLYKAIHPILKGASFMEGATATMRFGDPQDSAAHEITVEV